MSSLNKVMLIGNLGKDPETRYSPAGLAISNFSIATTEKVKDQPDKTEWHRVVTFGKIAESCGQYLTKGRTVYVEGRLQTSTYEKDGITRYSTEVIAHAVKFLGAPSTGQQGGGNGAPQGGGYGAPQGGGNGAPQGGGTKRFSYPSNNYPQDDLPY